MIKPLIHESLRWAFWNPARIMVQAMPQRSTFTIARASAAIYEKLHGRRLARIRQEVERTNLGLSGAALEREIRLSSISLMQSEIEMLRYPTMSKSNIADYTSIIGEEHLKAALERGKGVLLLHAHYANAQMLMPTLGYRDYKVNQVGLAPEFVVNRFKELFNREISPSAKKQLELRKRCELSLPAKYIYLHSSYRPAFEALKRNELVAMAIDGLGGMKRMELNFLGRKADFSAGPLSLALKTKATVLPLFNVRHGHRIDTVIEPPLEIPAEDGMDTLEKHTARMVAVLERYIGLHPGHYIRLFGYDRPFFTDLVKREHKVMGPDINDTSA